MSKYMLITVCEREIETECFDTFEKAFDKMFEELNTEFFRNEEFNLNKQAIKKEVAEHGMNKDNTYDFCIGKNWAWSNIDYDWRYDWKIVEVN